MSTKRAVIVGGGFAGLSAAYTLMKRGITLLLLEAQGAQLHYVQPPMNRRQTHPPRISPRERAASSASLWLQPPREVTSRQVCINASSC